MNLLDKLFSASEKTPGYSGTGWLVITGAAGFIGSCVVQFLNEQGYENLVLVDDFGVEEKRVNWEGKKYIQIVERYNLFNWLKDQDPKIDFFIHLGARTDTTEFDYAVHQELNVDYSQNVWEYCTRKNVPLVYASSAATYGSGELGYDDSHEIIERLQPLNPYGVSKNEFDKWAIKQNKQPPFWAGLKFFNVYGPNEYHKARMASVIFHSYNQIRSSGSVKLFRSHKASYLDGEQLRDFVYVKDVTKVIYWMIKTTEDLAIPDPRQLELEESRLKDDRVLLNDGGGEVAHSDTRLTSGIYNLGTGQARSFVDLVNATFSGLDMTANIEFVDMPEDIRDKYQYFTEANMHKLRQAGYTDPFYQLEEGVDDYVRNYLSGNLGY
ncbi:ADP-glyceromanno-heptose 6-epimerase [Segetibacter sp. 3557_3]|uniref:ADP-glyceromanno-heptose 6-epimerase n=1 Tax=Segetibacter sp. 3557_3 TaxID=2547429 RepID=UPI001058EC00|nr:ADP-glyceromanno-heptose 6-epimerase [Segetibacter sp. 3557_3]TDH18301.1 ADP-glyceromanno-heptose 6-epimerase [Segetibacter sp. 3557_3]